MPWTTIAYVGSGVSLVAFLAALVAWVIRYLSRQKERLILTAPEADRAALVDGALEFLRIPAESLTRAHRYDVAIEQIRARANRFAITAVLIFLLSLVAAAVTAFAIYRADPLADVAAAFDVNIDRVAFIPFGDQTKAVVTYSLFPISKSVVGDPPSSPA